MTLEIITNNRPRDIIDGWELSDSELEKFDYLENPRDNSFFRYRGQLHDIGEFMRVPKDSPLATAGFNGYSCDTYFSGIAIKLSPDGESVTVARFYS